MAKVKVDINGKETVSKAAKQAENSLKSLATGGAEGATSSLTSLAGAAGIAAAAIYGAIKTVSDLTAAYSKQENAEAKLEAALNATKHAAGITKQEMLNYATELSKLTGIGDEVIIGAQGLMTTFTKVGKDVFPTAIEAAADMSAMFGQDLQQSVIQLGTALNDPIAGVGRLKRIGVSFSEDQKKMIEQFVAQNDIMGAQKVILDELENEFGGVAEKMGGTWSGSVSKFKNAWGDFKEVGGEVLAGFFTPILDKLTEFINKTTDAAKATRNLKKAIEGDAGANMASAYEMQAQKVQETKEQIARLEESIAQSRLNTDNRVILLIGAKEAALANVNARLNTEIQRMMALEVATKNEADALAEIKKNVAEVTKDWNALAQTYRDKVAKGMEEIAIKEKVMGDGFDDTKAKIDLLSDTLIDMYKNGFTEGSRTVIDFTELLGTLSDAAEVTAKKTDEVAEAMANAGDGALLIYPSMNGNITASGSEGESSGESGGGDDGANYAEEIGASFGELGQLLSGAVDPVMMVVSAIGSALMNIEEFGQVLNFVTTIVTGVINTLLDPLLAIANPLLEVISGVVETLGNALLPIFEALAPIMNTLTIIFREVIGNQLARLEPVFAAIAAVLKVLNPVITALAVAFTVLWSPVRYIGDLFRWLGGWIKALGEIVYYAITFQWDKIKTVGTPGAFTSDAFTGLQDRINEVINAGAYTPGEGGADDDGADDDISIHGGNTTVQRVPDIYIYNTIQGNIYGEEGSASFGEHVARAIEAYYGIGGRIAIMEGGA